MFIGACFFAQMELEDPRSLDYIDGVAIHYYGNFFPPAILSALQRRYPDKMLLSTEACEGIQIYVQYLHFYGFIVWVRRAFPKKYRQTTFVLEPVQNQTDSWRGAEASYFVTNFQKAEQIREHQHFLKDINNISNIFL